jgi:hypothetical protein
MASAVVIKGRDGPGVGVGGGVGVDEVIVGAGEGDAVGSTCVSTATVPVISAAADSANCKPRLPDSDLLGVFLLSVGTVCVWV